MFNTVNDHENLQTLLTVVVPANINEAGNFQFNVNNTAELEQKFNQFGINDSVMRGYIIQLQVNATIKTQSENDFIE